MDRQYGHPIRRQPSFDAPGYPEVWLFDTTTGNAACLLLRTPNIGVSEVDDVDDLLQLLWAVFSAKPLNGQPPFSDPKLISPKRF